MSITINTIGENIDNNFSYICLHRILLSIFSNIEKKDDKIYLTSEITSWIISWRVSGNEVIFTEKTIDFTKKYLNISTIFDVKNEFQLYKKEVSGHISLPFKIKIGNKKENINNSSQIMFGFKENHNYKDNIINGCDLISEFIFNIFKYDDGIFVLSKNPKIREWILSGLSSRYFDYRSIVEIENIILVSKNNLIKACDDNAILIGPTYESSNNIIIKEE
jgi:hypothetical protein